MAANLKSRRRSGRLLALAVLALLLAGDANADQVGQRLQAQVDASTSFINTESYTPAVRDEWSAACGYSHVQQINVGWVNSPLIQSRWESVPLPCNWQPAAGSDHEGVLRWHGRKPPGTYDYYEFWVNWWDNGWRAYWGGAANNSEFMWKDGVRVWPNGMGTQASGIAFLPGLLFPSEVQNDAINHVVSLQAWHACTTLHAPATRTDGVGGSDCVEYGTLLKLPAGQDLSGLSATARALAHAAQRYGLMVTDQTGWGVNFRGQNLGASATWPIAFGCPSPCSSSQWNWSYYPDKNNRLWGFPWADLYVAN